MGDARPHDTVFAWRLAEIRSRRCETIAEFSRACGVSDRTMDDWLAGKSEPLLSYAMKVARATGYDLDDLVDSAVPLPAEPRRPCERVETHVLYKGAVGSTVFAAGFKRALKASGMTLKDLAEDIGVARSSVQKWPGGESEPRITSAMRAATLLGVRLHDIATGAVV